MVNSAHSISSAGRHSCQWGLCRNDFDNVTALGKHILEKHINAQGGMGYLSTACQWENCPRQGKPFSTKMKLIMHVRAHTGEKPYACSVPNCGKKFARMDILNKHLRSHVTANTFVCIIHGCGKIFADQNSLLKHKESHPVLKPFVCPIESCGKRYTDANGLSKHTEKFHNQHNNNSKSITKKEPQRPTTNNVITISNNDNYDDDNGNYSEIESDEELEKLKSNLSSEIDTYPDGRKTQRLLEFSIDRLNQKTLSPTFDQNEASLKRRTPDIDQVLSYQIAPLTFSQDYQNRPSKLQRMRTSCSEPNLSKYRLEEDGDETDDDDNVGRFVRENEFKSKPFLSPPNPHFTFQQFSQPRIYQFQHSLSFQQLQNQIQFQPLQKTSHLLNSNSNSNPNSNEKSTSTSTSTSNDIKSMNPEYSSEVNDKETQSQSQSQTQTQVQAQQNGLGLLYKAGQTQLDVKLPPISSLNLGSANISTPTNMTTSSTSSSPQMDGSINSGDIQMINHTGYHFPSNSTFFLTPIMPDRPIRLSRSAPEFGNPPSDGFHPNIPNASFIFPNLDSPNSFV